MINIRDGELANMLPIQFTRQPQVLAISYALKHAYLDMLAYQAKLLIYADIDAAQESVLDYLALEFSLWGYRTDMEIERKREIIKNAFGVALSNGTRYALDSLLGAAYENVDAKEWFEYNGDPGYFRIRLDPSNNYNIDELLEAIEKRKRKSAHLDTIGLLSRADLLVGIAASTAESLAISMHTIDIVRQPENAVVALGDTGAFEIVATGVNSYQWQVNSGARWANSNANGNKTARLSNTLTEVRYSYLYRCTMLDAYGNQYISNEVHYINPDAEEQEQT